PVRVLLVDDDEDDYLITRDLISQIRDRRYQLEWFNNFEDGVEAVKRREHDLCLLDYRLGEHTGLELLREAQELHIRMPIILLTGQGDQEIDLEAMKAGAADYLVKGHLTSDGLERAMRYAIEHKRTQETLRRERDFVARIMDTSPAGIIVTDCSGKITFANHRAEEVLGISKDTADTRNVLDWQPTDNDGNPLPETRSPLKQVLETGQRAQDVRHLIYGTDGTRTLLSTNATPLFDPANKIHGMVVTVEDITQRLSLEAQLRQSQKMESVGQLAAGVAHDINNILTIIQGHTGLLLNQSERFEEDAVKSLKQIAAASARAAGFVQRLLAFSRKQIYRTKILDVNAVIHSLELVLPRLLGETINLEVHCHADLPRVAADVAMIEQIIMNLAVNSRDAMPRGGKLMIETSALAVDNAALRHHPEAHVGRFVCLTITDTGCGMERSVLQRIFEPFFTTKEVGKGTGLGLATVYGIVKQLRGWIEVQSEVGVGSTFKVFLPSAAETAAPAPAPDPAENVRGGEETILFVEDEKNLLDLMREVLSQYRYKVLTASSGLDALKVWEKHEGPIHLLFTDVVMPGGMTGTDLASVLKKREPGMKVILSSGYSSAHAGSELNKAETIFLSKPYQPHEAAALVRKTLDTIPPAPEKTETKKNERGRRRPTRIEIK
ncbi:MAG TPA: response regulator, partial [Verrucomicrobiae bacterium]|nr:response regulator [Verrucomicrobiae bacterium]